jgi:hypothetical protein
MAHFVEHQFDIGGGNARLQLDGVERHLAAEGEGGWVEHGKLIFVISAPCRGGAVQR